MSVKTIAKDACHRQHDALSFDLHKALCEKLVANPSLIEELRKHNTWLKEKKSCSLKYSLQWEKVLNEGIKATINLALEKSDRGQVLRTCSPFAIIVDQRWRHQFLREWNEKYKTHEDICKHELFKEWGNVPQWLKN